MIVEQPDRNRSRDYRLARRAALAVSLVCIAICIVLLLNITADNPTGRRYSSETVNTQGLAAVKGTDGERILASDLGIPNNNDVGQLKCICDSRIQTVPYRCSVCAFRSELPDMRQYAIPDFIGKRYIADSKNTSKLSWTGDLLAQLDVYAKTAQKYGLELWIFVRVDTEVDPRYYDLIERTGGGIVPYFAVPGYDDPVDEAATTGLLISIPLGFGTLVLELRPYWPKRRRPGQPRRPAPPKPQNSVEEAELFRDTLRQKAQVRIDRDDALRPD